MAIRNSDYFINSKSWNLADTDHEKPVVLGNRRLFLTGNAGDLLVPGYWLGFETGLLDPNLFQLKFMVEICISWIAPVLV